MSTLSPLLFLSRRRVCCHKNTASAFILSQRVHSTILPSFPFLPSPPSQRTMLFSSADISLWESVLVQYDEALQLHVTSKKDDSLLDLDHWYQTTLPSLLVSRQPKWIDSKELCQLMSWKLKRGKFRPSLAKLAASNADKDVKRISQEAFQLLSSDLKTAITKMAELKGVGPATASAILCAGAPAKVPFMADETMDSVPGLGTIAYTIPYYIKFATKVIEKAAELKKKGSTIVDSPHLVEKALWTEFMLNKYGIQRKIAGSSSTSARVSAPASTQERKESNATKAATKEDGSSSNKNSKRKAEEIDAKATGTGIKHQKQTSASAMKTKSSTTPASTPAPAAGVRRSARSRS